MAAKKIIDDLKAMVSLVRSRLQAKSNGKKLAAAMKRINKPKGTPKKRLPGKNPTDPIVIPRSVVEAAIGEPLTHPKPKKKTRKSK